MHKDIFLMNLAERIDAFSKLGLAISDLSKERINRVLENTAVKNPWFTVQNQQQAILEWSQLLNSENLYAWLTPYHLIEHLQAKRVLIIMAGNIPMVGFHDLLSVLITGNRALIKLSSNDDLLIPFLISELLCIEPKFSEAITFANDVRNQDFDAVIATGSDNSASYFEYYFRNQKTIIRKNRKSLAILSGDESKLALEFLGKDIFSYFGLGCRNVSMLFIPKQFEIHQLFEAFYPFRYVIDHKKYANNYDYHKAMYLMGKHTIWDNGFLLLKEEDSLHSPLAVLHYQRYEQEDEVQDFICQHRDQLQCVVSKNDVSFGESQSPNLWDYADGLDTIAFLADIYSTNS